LSNVSDFLSEANQLDISIKQDKYEEFKELLSDYAKKVNMLNYGENNDYTRTEHFHKVVNMLPDYPPIKLLEDILNYYKTKRHTLVTKDIPSVMQQMGISKATTTDGLSVKVNKEVSVKEVNKVKLMEWAVSNGYEDHIKTFLKFGKGDFNQDIEAYLSEQGISYEKDVGIHPQTLKKIIKDRIDAEEELPSDNLIEVKTFNIAKIK
jgi:hypothetical protein